MAAALDAAGTTQREFAVYLQQHRGTASRVTQGFVAQMIAGQRHVAADVLDALTSFTGVPLDYIQTGQGWEPPPSPVEVGQRLKRTHVVPLDAALISTLRLHGRTGYRLSQEARRGVVAALNQNLDTRQQVGDGEELVIVVLGKQPRPRAKPRT